MRRLQTGLERPHHLGRAQLLRLQGPPRDRRRATLQSAPCARRPARRVGLAGPVRRAHPSREHRPGAGAGAGRPLVLPGGAGAPGGAAQRGREPRPATGAADRRVPGRGHAAGRVPAAAGRAGAEAAGAGAAARAPGGAGRAPGRYRRPGPRGRDVLPAGAGGASRRVVRAEAAARRAAHRPGGGHRRRGRDPLRRPDRPARRAHAVLSFALGLFRSANARA